MPILFKGTPNVVLALLLTGLFPLTNAVAQSVGDQVIDALAPGEWYEVPDSRLYDVQPPVPAPGDFAGIVYAWSGGALDSRRSRLVVWGGGGGTYAGNELYAFDLNSLQWSRLTEPTLTTDGDVDGDGAVDIVDERTGVYPDGQPRSRMTYSYVEYLPQSDQFCSFGGHAFWYSGQSGSHRVDCYDFESAQWVRRSDRPDAIGAGFAVHDPVTDTVWSGKSRLTQYDPGTDTWGRQTEQDFGLYWDYYTNAVLDPVRRLVVVVGRGRVRTWDIGDAQGPLTLQELATTGDTEILNAPAPGLAYDPVLDRIVAWSGGSDVYLLDLDTATWTLQPAAATSMAIPGSAAATGTYGRFRYVPDKNVFVAVSSVYSNVHILKLSDRPEPEPSLNAVLADGTDPAAGLAPGQWYEIPDTRLDAVLPDLLPAGDPSGVVNAWSGGALDTSRNRLVLWGGGHSAYSGNELYAFDLDTYRWHRLTSPSGDVLGDVDGDGDFDQADERTGVYPDGRPRARHTYNYVEYLPQADQFCSFGAYGYWYSGQTGSNRVDCYDFGTASWVRRADRPDFIDQGYAVFDPLTGTVWSGMGALSQYDPVSDSWLRSTPVNVDATWKTGQSVVYSPAAGKILAIGHGAVFEWSIGQAGDLAAARSIQTTGPRDILDATAPALAFDPIANRVIGWAGGTGVLSLDLETYEWTRHGPASSNVADPGAPSPNGTFGRFRYLPSKNLFVVVNAIDRNVFLYRFADAGGATAPVAAVEPTMQEAAAAPGADVSAPTAPAQLLAQVTAGTGVVLSWQAASDDVGVVQYRVHRNGVQVGAGDLTGFTDHTALPGARYTYAVVAVDAAGNVSSPSNEVEAVLPGGAASGPASYEGRCSDPATVRCMGFDTQAEVEPYLMSGSATPSVDVQMRASGAGSLHMVVPSQSGANTSGSFSMNFTPGTLNYIDSDFRRDERLAVGDTSDYGYPVQFGEGEEFYVQWRQRFSSAFLDTYYEGGAGWKQAIIGEGDRPGHRAHSCTQLEIVLQNTYQRGVPQMYHSCGLKDSKYEGIEEFVPPYDYDFQPGGDNECLYSAVSAGGPGRENCTGYAADEWMTFQVRVKVGTWYRNNGVYHRDSEIDLWVAREGQPSRHVIAKRGYDIANDVGGDVKYGKVWLLPYHTSKSPAQAHPQGDIWYDDLIVSRARIPDPPYAQGDSTAPSAPASVTAQVDAPGAVTVQWPAASDPESGVAHYRVYRSDRGAPIGFTSSLSFSDTGAAGGVPVTYAVEAVNLQGLASSRSTSAPVTP